MDFNRENTAALGKVASGLYIITAGAGDGATFDGYLGSWVQQASFQPLLVTVAIKPGRPCWDFIHAHGRFCINVVGHNNQGVVKRFWRGYDPQAAPITDLPHRISAAGNLLLLDCMAAIECERLDEVRPGDHDLLIAKVLECHTLQPEDKVMFHVRRSGLEY